MASRRKRRESRAGAWGELPTGSGGASARAGGERPVGSPSPPVRAVAVETGDAEPTDGWRGLHLWQIQPVRDIMVGLGIFFLFYLGYLLSFVTIPVLLAMLLAYLFEPVISRLVRLPRVSRQAAAVIVLVLAPLVVALPIIGVVSLGLAQAGQFTARLIDNTTDLIYVYENPDDPAAQALKETLPTPYNEVADFLLEAKSRSEAIGEPSPGVDPREDPATGLPIFGPPVPDDADTEDEPLIGGRAVEARVAGAVRDWLAVFFQWFEGHSAGLREAISVRLVGAGQDALSLIVSLVGSLVKLGFMVFLTGFFFFFVSSSFPGLVRFGRRLIPVSKRERVEYLVGRMDNVTAAFVRGRITIMIVLMAELIVLYALIGVPMPLVLGVLVGMLSIAPYLSLIGLPISIVVMALEPASGLRGEWWWIIAAPIVVYQLVQMSDDYIWTPLIQGPATDMDTPTILFAVLSAGILFGFYGILVAIPLAACLKILIIELFWPRLESWIEGRRSDMLPVER